MNLNDFKKSKCQIGDTLVLMGEKKIVIKELHHNKDWIHIVDTKGFNYTHKDIVEIIHLDSPRKSI